MDELRIAQEELTWQNFAICLGVNPDIFFPERGGDNSVAKAICAQCVVRVDCLQYALDNKEMFGVWGGTTLHDRRKIWHAIKVERELKAAGMCPELAEGCEETAAHSTEPSNETEELADKAPDPKTRYAFTRQLTSAELAALYTEQDSFMLDDNDDEQAW